MRISDTFPFKCYIIVSISLINYEFHETDKIVKEIKQLLRCKEF